LLNEAVETKDMYLIEKLISDFSNSIQYKIQTCWKTLKKWKAEIKNFFDTWITNAFTEGKNTKAKLFKRMAYWYGKKDNYIKRLLICL
jgi:transposase